MTATRRALAALLIVGAVALVGCGRDDAPPPEDVSGPERATAPVDWDEATVPIVPGADTTLRTGADGDRIVMVATTEEGDVTSAVLDGDGAVETGPPLATGADLLRLGGLARFDGAWWAVGSGGTRAVPSRPDDWETTFDLHLVRSDDGLTWTQVATTGLEGPAEVTDLVATDRGLVAVGHDQSGNLDGGDMAAGFGARAWRSADGTAWEEVAIPAVGARFGVSSLTVLDDGLLAVGGNDEGTVAWRSDDDGASWTDADLGGLDEGVRLSHVVPFGDGLLASGAGPATEESDAGTPPAVHRSTDGGRSWHRIDGPPASTDSGWAPLFPAGDRVFTILSTYFDPGANPLACYADEEQCTGGSEAVLYQGDEAGAWSRIDLSDLGLVEHQRVEGVVATDDRLVLWGAGVDGVDTWSTSVDAALPAEPEPEIATADLPMLEAGEEPEVGVRYAAPLYTHCGMDWLYLGEEPWQRTDDGTDVSNGGYVYGFATRVDEDTVEYSLDDGEVVATYGPPREEPPGCM